MKKRNPAKAQTSTKYDDRYQDDRLPFSIFIHALVSYVLPPFSLYTTSYLFFQLILRMYGIIMHSRDPFFFGFEKLKKSRGPP